MKTGWLSPTGELIECAYFDHYATAKELVNKLSKNIDKTIEPDDLLLQCGYAKLGISMLGMKSYYVIRNRKLTECQRYFLKDIIEDENPDIPIDSLTLAQWKYEDDYFLN